jgi:hypothetical protein
VLTASAGFVLIVNVGQHRARRISTRRIAPVTRTGHAWITGVVVDLMP